MHYSSDNWKARAARALCTWLALSIAAAPAAVAGPGGGGGGGLSVVDTNAPHIDRGVYYSEIVVSASGGTAPYSFTTASPLPAAMTLAADGTLSGTTCGSNGNYVIGVTVTDATAATATGNVQLIVNAAPAGGCSLTFSSTTLAAGTVGTPYIGTVSASGGTAPYTYSLSSGALPAGLNLLSSGAITGMPTASGSSTFSITANDAGSRTGVQTYTLTINAAGAVSLMSSPSANTQVGVAYSQSNSASGGSTPYAYAVSAGALPAGTSLNTSTGTVSGTPTTAGAFSYTITVTDAASATASQTTSGTIAAAAASLSLAAIAASAQQMGVAYSQQSTASGGSTPYAYAYAISAGSLPAGVSLNASSGLASGTPTSAGAYSYTVRVTDGASATATQTVFGTIAAALALAAMPPGAKQVGVAYSQANTASNGTSPYTYAVSAGALPAGLTLNTSSGAVSGTPTSSGAYSYTIRVTDANGATATQTTSGSIAAALALASTPSANTQLGAAYSQANSASGGTAPYTYAISGGSLPAGLNLNTSSGTVSGTPTATGAFSYTVRATDSNGASATQTLSGTIGNAPSLSMSTAPAPAAEVGVAYSQANTAAGGSGSYTHSIVAGALPAGLVLNSATGVVSGTPTTSGAFSYTVRAIDNGNGASSVTGSAVGGSIAAALQIASAAPASAPQAGLPWTQGNAAANGIAPYVFALAAGSLPPGTSLDAATGTVSGTPTSSGAFAYRIRVSDAAGAVAVGAQITGSVAAAPTLALSPGTLVPASVNVALTQPLVPSGGSGPYALSLAAGALPPGVTLDASGLRLVGTPTTVGSYSFTLRLRDAQGYAIDVPMTWTIKAVAVRITTTTAPVVRLNQTTSTALQASGGVAPYTFSVSAGSLPDGLTLAPNGTLSGRATRGGVFRFTVTVTDSNADAGGPNRSEQAYTVSVGLRADPSADAQVRTLLAQQADAVRRVAAAQLDNLRGRTQALHAQDSACGPAGGQASATTPTTPAPGNTLPGQANGLNLPLGGCLRQGDFTLWSGGSLQAGSHDARGGAIEFDVRSNGITVGVDRRFARGLTLGAGLGAAHARSRADGANGVETAANTVSAWSALGYASWRLQHSLFLDAAAGVSSLDLDSSRLTSDGSTAGGKRRATQWFASLEGSMRQRLGAIEAAPYARLEAMRARLRAFDETAANGDALAYDAQSLPSLRVAFGVDVGWRVATAWGALTPTGRLEWRHESQRAGSAGMRYADDLQGPSYAVEGLDAARGSMLAGVGATWWLAGGWSLAANADIEAASGQRSHRLGVRVLRSLR